MSTEESSFVVESLGDRDYRDGMLDITATQEEIEAMKAQKELRKEKKRKKFQEMREKKKSSKREDVSGAEMRKMDSDSIANFLWQNYQHSNVVLSKQLSSEEQAAQDPFHGDDILIMDSELDKMNSIVQLTSLIPDWDKKSRSMKKQSPLILVVCPSAIRSADVCRILRPSKQKNSDIRVGKLFAKHIKMDEQVSMLERINPNIVVGTPNRLLKLCECGALDLQSSSMLILIDMHQDAKKFTLLTLSQVAADFFKWMDIWLIPNLGSRGGQLRLCIG